MSSLTHVATWMVVVADRREKVKSLSPIQLLETPWLFSPWNSPGQNTGMGSLPLLQGIFPTRDRTQVSHIAGDSLPAKAPGESKNTGVGTLSLLLQIFLTQESNRGLLHCRRSLYQPCCEGSPAEKSHGYLQKLVLFLKKKKKRMKRKRHIN